MDSILESVRELALEAIDRRDDIGRVAGTGPWPALVAPTGIMGRTRDIWTPHAVYVIPRWGMSPVLADLREHVVDRRPMPPELARLIEDYECLSAAHRIYQLSYSLLVGGRTTPSAYKFRILLDPESGITLFDTISLTQPGGRRLVADIRPGKEALERAGQAQEELNRQNEEFQAALKRARENRDRWNKERVKVLGNVAKREGIDCPKCGERSKDYRVMEYYLICRRCGCSFQPEDMPGERLPPDAIPPENPEEMEKRRL